MPYFSGKITNSFFNFFERYELDTGRFFQMTRLEMDFIRDPLSWMDAEQVELLLRNIQRAYQPRFIDKDLLACVAHNAPDLKSWGELDRASLAFCDNSRDLYGKLDKILSFFVSPAPSVKILQDDEKLFVFKTDFNAALYPTVKDYLQSVFEILPVFLNEEQTEAHWDSGQVKIHYVEEKTLPLPLTDLQKPAQKSFAIDRLKGRELIDSRGTPALEAEVFLKNKLSARAMVPSGASTGRFEARELRDGDPNRFFSKGLKTACQNIKALGSVLKGQNVLNQPAIDRLLIEKDGTDFKEKLGANTLLAISLACLRAGAKAQKKPLYEYAAFQKRQSFSLPAPLMNIINGGLHADGGLEVQEIMIAPFGFESFKDSLRAGCEIFQCLKRELKAKGFSVNVGDEGGFAPGFASCVQAFDFILSVVEKCSYTGRVALALDCASSEFYRDGLYHFEGQGRTSEQMIALYEKWAKDYPLISIEDGLSEEDWPGWVELTRCLGQKLQLVGDDLFVTRKQRVQKGIQQGAGNALLVKCNQIGAVTETWEAVQTAQKEGWACILSHRSGETEDTIIADLAVAWGAEQIKTGGLCRGERTAKYNRLLRIEEELGRKACFHGKKAFKAFSKKTL